MAAIGAPVTAVTDASPVTADAIPGVRMSFEYLVDPSNGPQWKGVLPGKPQPYVLKRGDGEHAMLFTDLFTVLLSGDETEGQFGIITSESPAGDIIPTHSHNETHETFFVLEGKVRLYFQDAEGTRTTKLLEPGRFERFFQHMGQPTDHGTAEQPPFIPDFPRMQAAAQQHNMQFMPDFDWTGAQE